MRRSVIWGLVGLVILGGGLFTFRNFQAPIGLALYDRAVEQRVAGDVLAELPEGLHLIVCGSGSPFPDLNRAGPCLAVIAGDRLFVVDSGSGSSRNLTAMGLPIGTTEAVFLTHYHSDHISDLGELMMQRWVVGTNTAPLPIYGPAGVAQVVQGFVAAYGLDSGYRTAHHTAAIAPPSGAGGVAIEVPLADDSDAYTVVIDNDDLQVTMFRVSHNPISPAVGYRFDYRGRSIVISGDTTYQDSVVAQATGVDLLVHEALQPELVGVLTRHTAEAGTANIAQITEDILDYHTTPTEAARIAREAGVDALVLYHLVPVLPSRLFYPAFLGDAASEFDGPITVSEDRMIFSLPVGAPGDVIEGRL